jgi:hypothetical protein
MRDKPKGGHVIEDNNIRISAIRDSISIHNPWRILSFGDERVFPWLDFIGDWGLLHSIY